MVNIVPQILLLLGKLLGVSNTSLNKGWDELCDWPSIRFWDNNRAGSGPIRSLIEKQITFQSNILEFLLIRFPSFFLQKSLTWYPLHQLLLLILVLTMLDVGQILLSDLHFNLLTILFYLSRIILSLFQLYSNWSWKLNLIPKLRLFSWELARKILPTKWMFSNKPSCSWVA